MAKTKSDVVNEIKDYIDGANNYDAMIKRIANYIVKNYKLKKTIITQANNN